MSQVIDRYSTAARTRDKLRLVRLAGGARRHVHDVREGEAARSAS